MASKFTSFCAIPLKCHYTTIIKLSKLYNGKILTPNSDHFPAQTADINARKMSDQIMVHIITNTLVKLPSIVSNKSGPTP